MEIVTYRIVGLSPLLMHNPAQMSQEQPRVKFGVKTIPKPEDEAEAGAYRLKDGTLYAPSDWFREALLQASRGKRFGKISAYQIISSSVFLVRVSNPLLHPETGEKLVNYEIDTRRAVVNNQGIPRCRPLISAWSLELPLEVDREILVHLEPLTELLNAAGKFPGVGDYRVGKGGTFGRFRAELIPQTNGKKKK